MFTCLLFFIFHFERRQSCERENAVGGHTTMLCCGMTLSSSSEVLSVLMLLWKCVGDSFLLLGTTIATILVQIVNRINDTELIIEA